MMPRRRWTLLFAALAAASLLAAAGMCVWGVRQPEVSSYDCLVGGRFIRQGPALRVHTEWVIDDDLVPVLAQFRRQGWQSSTQMTTNIQMLPASTTALDMGVVRVKVFRALSLSYTQAGTTRVAASTRFVACP